MTHRPDATVGVDFAGEVVALGQAIDSFSSPPALENRVCDCVFGINPDQRDNGAFAEYVAVPVSLVLCIPESINFAWKQSWAIIGMPVSTAATRSRTAL
ncbi:uncharacterized protein N7503_004299 [Penicillium pulvis]|uniref:uncharacterized protein n=1 Tax=Penicillium pulvis TaxID=1562058 RepID=UPI0025493904|nr:uncharacterized protein N7503_004299 [Penicillium pulvis]KAJ5801849.1 hypothetical protein N7503_004299 [Penicillium pulvis]